MNNLFTYEHGYPSIHNISMKTGKSISQVKEKMKTVPEFNVFSIPKPIHHFRKIEERFKDDIWSVDLFETQSLFTTVRKVQKFKQNNVFVKNKFERELESFYRKNE